MKSKIMRMKQRGQGLVEYSLILVLMAIVVLIMLAIPGIKVFNMYSSVAAQLPG